MSIIASHGKPSNLAAVLENVKRCFDLIGDATPVLVGEQYLEDGALAYPRVVLVPEKGQGRIAPPITQGHGGASQIHSCDVYVRSAAGLGDVERFTAVYDLLDIAISALYRSVSGRVEWGAVADDSPTKTDGFGAGLKVSFTYRRDI